ncbi:uncharacterized protein PV09_06759 [Verruconis gallopava]|uniref:Uncharacterized protein n=1 Tax=Verruconis gallopava TaxID=253628 RepID=A0A0D2A592_9PEZI|nr:uncharacterized protein PV09_06759 [Verruconis gallopava]KIW01918.1 hypothetical protein PV09_06759 [Verruconis gallopava]
MHLPKFEQISALKHHCGVCQTPFSNPSSLSTCIGKHEVICANYHFMFHFIGKAHTCRACVHAKEQQEKRHRTILLLMQIYQKENEEAESEIVTGSAAAASGHQYEGMKKKERKALKKAARTSVRLDIITQADISRLHAIIYPPDSNTEDANKALARALSVKSSTTILSEKSMLDALVAPPKKKPDLELEARRVIASYKMAEPRSKQAKLALEKIKCAIMDDVEIQWKTDLEMKKRRIIYAQWVTQGAVEKMALHHENWDINTRERLSRRDEGDRWDVDTLGEVIEVEGNTDGEDGLDNDALKDTDFTERCPFAAVDDANTSERRSSTAESGQESPRNDRRRGGHVLHAAPRLPSHLAERVRAEELEKNRVTAPASQTPLVLRIVDRAGCGTDSAWISDANNAHDVAVSTQRAISRIGRRASDQVTDLNSTRAGKSPSGMRINSLPFASISRSTAGDDALRDKAKDRSIPKMVPVHETLRRERLADSVDHDDDHDDSEWVPVVAKASARRTRAMKNM